MARHRHDVIQALNVQPGERVLDLACGPAVNFGRIGKDVETNGLLVGVDHSFVDCKLCVKVASMPPSIRGGLKNETSFLSSDADQFIISRLWWYLIT
jgi:ubiquinone/menaquinone biosynthesis C-methylase UbiE